MVPSLKDTSEIIVSDILNLLSMDHDTNDLLNSDYDDKMYEICEEVEANDLFNSTYDEELYDACAAVEKQYDVTQQIKKAVKRVVDPDENKSTKRVRLEVEASSSSAEPKSIDERELNSEETSLTRKDEEAVSTNKGNKKNGIRIVYPFPGVEEVIREGFRRQKIPESTLDVMMSTVSAKMRFRYLPSLRLWWVTCLENGVDVYNFDTSFLLAFLTRCYENSDSIYKLNNHRYAISLISTNNLSNDVMLKRFFKGMQVMKPEVLPILKVPGIERIRCCVEDSVD